MKIRVLKNNDGTVSVIHPAPKSKFTIDEALDRMTPQGADYFDIDSSELPDTREDRNFWEAKGNKIQINKVKADKHKKEKAEEKLIKEEKEKILREQAITSLKSKGKIK